MTGLVVTILGTVRLADSASADTISLFSSSVVPRTITDPDRVPVELGMKFSSSVNGNVSGVRFYKGPLNLGRHIGTLWSSSGKKLASVTFTHESHSAWQTALFPRPVAIVKGVSYVVSYLAPRGAYSSEEQGFSRPVSAGGLTVPAGGGVYRYGKGGFPTSSYRNSNYFVDVIFEIKGSVPAGTVPSGTAPSGTASSSPKPSTSPTATATPPPVITLPNSPGNVSGTLNLPRIAWEGGSSYWKQFKYANAAGWSDPSFFPIVVWWDSVSTNADVAYDKSLGVNTFVQLWAGTDYKLLQDNGVFWIGDKLNSTFTDTSANWVGNFLDDEVDGRYTPAAGRAYLQKLADADAGNGRFDYANFTKSIISGDLSDSDSQAYVNNYTDAVSLDMYWYTTPYCSWTPYRGNLFNIPIDKAHCRTASSYGKTIDMLRQEDAVDGHLQPIWQFVENLNGGPGDGSAAVNITAGQLKGAVMNSVIHEARGIVYFDTSLSGSCQGGSIFHESQVANYCGMSQVAAAKEVDGQVAQLAPIINTQSYQYTFGTGLDTMLKTYDGSAYVFAMVDGASSPGGRTFTLPAGVTGRTVEVVNENRTLPVSANGTFTDTFANEYSYHIYRITL
jgi:hypothetical protein